MRVVFIGAVKFSARALEVLIDMPIQLVGVCTLKESTFNTDHVDLRPIAEKKNIPVRYTPNINSEANLSWIRSLEPDAIFCFGWSRLIRKNLLDLPPLGVIGFHPAALPANRGRHPIIWALVLGLQETASTFFFMDEGADSGDIISQEYLKITESDDAGILYEKITQTALKQLREFVPRLAQGNCQRMLQDTTRANVWRKRGKPDGCIDWRMAAVSIHNLVRGLSRPYVGAHFECEGEEIKVWRTSVEKDATANIEPGKVLECSENGILVKAGIGAIRLHEIEPSISTRVGEYL